MKTLFSRQLVVGLLSAALISSIFTGCQTKPNDPKKPVDAVSQGTGSYPIKTKGAVTLKYWRGLEPGLTKYASNFGDTDFAKELEKRTGIKIEYVHPPSGADSEKQAFNMMIASRDLPDLIEYNINNLYPGGPEKALNDEIIRPLNELASKYSPDLVKFLDKEPEIKKYCITNNGKLVMYPSTLHKDELYESGPMIRKDILDGLNLKVPETIDEWYVALKKIKESGKVQYPLSWSEKAPKLKWSGEFTGAYGVLYGAWQKDENNRVQYGVALPQYKDFLIEFNKWFKEGLIDVEFAVQDRNTLRAKVADGKVAAYKESTDSMQDIISGWRAKEPDTKKVLVGAPHPTLRKGEKAPFGSKSLPIRLNSCVVITTACKYPEIAAQWLNYGYTEEGAKFYAYGVEGKSYQMQGDKIVAADWIIKPPANITKETVRYNWFRTNGPFIAQKNFIPDELQPVQEVVEAREKIWTNVSNELRIPELAPTPEKANRYATLYSEVDTYTDEMFVKFIMGQESLDYFDKYVERLNKLGLQECTQIQQELLDAWNKR